MPKKNTKPRKSAKATSFPIVGIGASAGGLEAFTELLKHLPLDTGMGFVLVQHLDPQHQSVLTQLLKRTTSLRVREVSDKQKVEPNEVYVIPPNRNLGIVRGVLRLHPRQQARLTRSIDFFFESLAEDQRERAIGVILSGTATDGTLGLESIKAEGGITFAQDESARYDSMPRSAIAAGCVDYVLSPEKIAKELARVAKHPYVAGKPSDFVISSDEALPTDLSHAENMSPARGAVSRGARLMKAYAKVEKPGENGLRKILLLLRNYSGVDFSQYKATTIRRRIARRLVLSKLGTLENYADSLRGDPKELEALYTDALISVTSFFRNPEAFEVLKRKVFPKILQQTGREPIRAWVLGCSTGQEAYSIAMTFVESAEKAPVMHKLQVFATDLPDALLDKARYGLYAKSLVQDISPERLRRFFVEEEGGYRVTKALREMVVFARQNLISDPPFSRMDLISCRNLLIYLEPSLQRKVMPIFHYALRPHGFLFLGASESISGMTDLFEPIDKKYKIFSKKGAPTRVLQLSVEKKHNQRHRASRSLAHSAPLTMVTGHEEIADSFRTELNAQREADRVTVSQFAPPGVLINADLQVLQFRGPTRAYLEPPTGKATFDLLKMARNGLMLPLRSAINKAKKENKTVRRENVTVQRDRESRKVNIEVIPLKHLKERCLLVLFEEAEKPGANVQSLETQKSRQARTSRANTKEESLRILELESELFETRDYLQSIQEQHEAANEELQASNEEVQSANEELQSINEELETSKEELESTNEELTTVNEEMASRYAELNRLNSDLLNVQNSSRLAIVLLGRDLTIRRFSAQAEKQFNLLATDVGRPFNQVRHNLVFEDRRAPVPSKSFPAKYLGMERRHGTGPSESSPDLESLITDVIASVQERQREIHNKEGRWYSLLVRPYLTRDNRVDGAVLVLTDIHELKKNEHAVIAARDYAEAILRTVPDPFISLDSNLRVDRANKAFYDTFHVTPAESEGRLVYELGNGQWQIPKLRELLEDILPNNSFFEDFEITHEFESIGQRTMLLNGYKLGEMVGHAPRILLCIRDRTMEKEFEDARREADQRKDEFLAMLSHELRNPLAPIRNALEILRLKQADQEAVRLASGMMERQVGQMIRVVDDLLDVSRISRGKIELRRTRVRLDSVVDFAIEALRSQLESKALDLTVTLPPQPIFLNADTIRLAQVLSNLLNNAIKFTNNGGRVWLTAEVGGVSKKKRKNSRTIAKASGIPRSGERLEAQVLAMGDTLLNTPHVIIRVRDTGIGIPADRLESIFDIFTQADNSAGITDRGLGIGLTLVKRLVELHDGTIEAFSAGLEKGSEFVLRLPILLESSDGLSLEPISSEPAVSKALRILIVDDNRDSAESLSMLLKLTGNETHDSYDGQQALEAASTFRPDVVLLDIGLPDMTGYEVARKLREQSWGQDIVLVALTGWGQERDRLRSKQAGFDHHLTKPVDPLTLASLLGDISRDGDDAE